MSFEQVPAKDDKDGLRLGGGAVATLSGAAVLVIFVLQNTEDTQLDFLFWNFTWPLWLLIIVSAVFGAIFWIGLGIMRRRARRKARRDD